MKYTVKYRQKGQWFWRTIKGVTGDGVETIFRFFTLEDDSMIYIGVDAEVKFDKGRAESILKSMSKEAGTAVQKER